MPAAPPTFEELLLAAEHSLWHMEMRDVYMRSDPAFVAWLAGSPVDPAQSWPWWFEHVPAAVGRGVTVRRARIVSEPISDYVRFEYEVTAGLNIAVGEDVRWLPRRRASDLCLPGNDFWLFDGHTVMINHFTGDGEANGQEVTDDPGLAKLCATAFEATWKRATPHSEYLPA